MSLLSTLTNTLAPVIPLETGVFNTPPPDAYAVITPMAEVFELFADDTPQAQTETARVSLFQKGSYTAKKSQIVRALLAAGFTVTDRRYIAFEQDTGYHHYAIDVMAESEYEQEG